MDPREAIIQATQAAVDDLFRYARAVPADRVEWKPAPDSRSVLEILGECSLSPNWGADLLRERKFEMNEQVMAEYHAARAQLTTVELCEAAARANAEKLYSAIRAFPLADMGETIFLPFGADHNWAIPKVMSLHWWNCTYHLGQIAYIQTMYGDKEMH